MLFKEGREQEEKTPSNPNPRMADQASARKNAGNMNDKTAREKT